MPNKEQTFEEALEKLNIAWEEYKVGVLELLTPLVDNLATVLLKIADGLTVCNICNSVICKCGAKHDK